MMNYISIGIVFAFAAAVQPGPFQAYLISQSLANGWRKTAIAAFAPVISDGPVALLTLLILTTLPGWLMQVLRCAGGIFLLYLAWTAFKTWRAFNIEQESPVNAAEKGLMKAVFVNLLNPNPYLGWSLVMGPLLLKGWREQPANGIALLAAFYTTIIICSFGIVVAFSSARHLGPRVSRFLIGVSALALAAFGLYQFWSGAAA